MLWLGLLTTPLARPKVSLFSDPAIDLPPNTSACYSPAAAELARRRTTMEAVALHPHSTPSPLAKAVISLLVIAHCFAIGVAVTSHSTPSHPAPQLAVAASQPLQPYLQATFLNNAYRFFAPNPGVPTHLWFRLQSSDGTIRWTELPGRPESTFVRGAYQRRLNLTLLVGQQVQPDPNRDGKLALTPLGETSLASVIRRVVSENSPIDHVSTVGVYLVQHGVITPQQIRKGWTPTDLRTYRPMFLGVFDADGESKDKDRPIAEQPIGQTTAGILWADVHSLLRKSNADPMAVLESLHLPAPVQQFLSKHPKLLDASLPADGLSERIDRLTVEGVGDA
jgi:hypothetical protein